MVLRRKLLEITLSVSQYFGLGCFMQFAPLAFAGTNFRSETADSGKLEGALTRRG
jgi:hypothetical protein